MAAIPRIAGSVPLGKLPSLCTENTGLLFLRISSQHAFIVQHVYIGCMLTRCQAAEIELFSRRRGT